MGGDNLSNFVFDNTPSHVFGLRIAHIGTQGVVAKNTYTDIELITDRSAKRIEPYRYGRRLPETLTFPMEIYNKHGKQYPSYEVQAIQEWLFGRIEPKFLSILDPDKGNEAYLCWLTNPSIVRLAGRVMGWRFDVVCAAPYSFTDIVETRFECVNDATIINFHNLSNIEDYLYPEMSIEMLGNNTFVLIENANDDNRLFSLTNIRQGNSIFVDNNRQFMKAANGDNVFQHFNLNWFRFAPGHNRLYVDGRCIITFRNRFMKAVGGY